MANLYQNRFRIESARATWHDYNGGIYFITICTAHKQCYFGCVLGGQMSLNPLGHFTHDNLEHANNHYPYLEIPLFVVMPNHVHAVVFVAGDEALVPLGTKGLLSIGIGGIKSAVTVYAHQNNRIFAWQPRFHDHIIRDHAEMNRIADYIENNPLNWASDCFYI